MNLYLNGHGYLTRTEACVKVPSGFSVRFYCKQNEMFDGRWEKGIVEGAVNDKSRPAGGFGQEAFELSTVPSGGECLNHVLTRPGNMTMYFGKFSELKEIKPLVSGAWVGVQLVDGDRLGIKDKNSPVLLLSDILAALSIAVPGGAVVHWCACRSPYDDPEGAIEQAKDSPKLPQATPNNVWG